MATLERSIVEYLSMLEHYNVESGPAGEVVDLAARNECSEDNIVIRHISVIVRDLPSPSYFLDVKFGTLAELLRKLEDRDDDRTYAIDQHGVLDVELDGDTSDLFSIAVGYVTQNDFWIEPRITNKPRSYQSIVEPIITACSIRLRSVVTSGITNLRSIRFRYRSNIEGCRDRSIDTDVKNIIHNVRSVTHSVKRSVPNLGRYDIEISGIDIVYWNALHFCEMLEQISEYFYALPIILPVKLVGSEIILMRMETWVKTRKMAREILATTIQRAYRKHLLVKKRRELIWLLSTRIPVTVEGSFPLSSRVIRFTV